MSRRQHLVQLDSLRGIAALTVAFSHFMQTMQMAHGPWSPEDPWFQAFSNPPLRALVAGHEAVVLFFVLSGFVLYLPYERGAEQPYGVFLVRRVCRIWIPYAVAVTLAIVFRALVYSGPVEGLSSWFNGTWRALDATIAIDHYTMLGVFDAAILVPVLWSLVQEMRISIVYPVIARGVRRAHPATAAAAGAGVMAVGLVLMWAFHADSESTNVLEAVMYSGCFVLGALLARTRRQVAAAVAALPPWAAVAGFAAALALYETTPLLPAVAKPLADPLITAGALGLVAFALGAAPVVRALSVRPVVWLGQVSYSVYLVHMVVVLVLMRAGWGHAPAQVLLALCLLVTLGSAQLMHRFVEQPAIALGKRLTGSHVARPVGPAAERMPHPATDVRA